MDKPEHDALLIRVKALIDRRQRRGFVTYDELNRALPQEQCTSEQIEDIMALFMEMGINVVEAEDGNGDDDDPVDVDPSSPQGPSPLRGEAEPAKPHSDIDATSHG